jgi:hypothetical protein
MNQTTYFHESNPEHMKIINSWDDLKFHKYFKIDRNTFEVYNIRNFKLGDRKWRVCFNSNDRKYKTVKMDGKTYPLRKMVAEQYVPNPNNYKFVKNKDGDVNNKSIDDLYWCRCGNPKGTVKNLLSYTGKEDEEEEDEEEDC